ncbi:MAG TPA: helicase C-terminal domain-containing protein, partial [Spirochaetales bacterium]|nr:helicase C-terminal domain-containing protein [Spirochaetales bacterium]
ITKLQNIKNLPPGVLKKFPDCSDAVRSASDRVDLACLDLLGDALNWRLTKAEESRAAKLFSAMGELERAVLSISELLHDALDEVPEESRAEQAVSEAGLALMRFSELAALCAKWREWKENQDSIFWMEKARTKDGDSFARLYVTPLDIGAIMNESVYEPFRSILCLSATLSVGGRFDFWKNRVGLSRSDHRALCAEFPSPFPFHKNALLAAADDAPMPDAPGWQDWINSAVARLIEASGGHALVLFTSYTSLRSAWDAVKPKLDALGISAFRQGDDERSRLMEKFKADISSVLFATDSFWEGVDAPGDTLQLVIMTKLPFRVPTDPVQMARSEAIEARGGNSFMDLSLPEAVIRFKQGFGRLIRHSDDRGAVAVLDARILKKRYGKLFIESLPDTKTSFKELSAIAHDIREFLLR